MADAKDKRRKKLRICCDVQIIYLYNICIREAFHISCQNILLRKMKTVTIRMVETILKVSVSRGYYILYWIVLI
jgi:hypothetical protein